MSKNELHPGAELKPGQALVSPNGYYSLSMQKDGNLVVYHYGYARWASNTAGQPVKMCAMQPDGNLVLYTGKGPVFATNTAGNEGAFLALQDDGNAVIYKGHTALWATNTCYPNPNGSLFPFEMVNTNPVKGRATAHISQHGIATFTMKGTHSGVSGSSKYKGRIVLADQDGNIVWLSPWETLTIGADPLKGKNTKEKSWEYNVPPKTLKLAKKGAILFDRDHSDWPDERLDDLFIETIKKADRVYKTVKDSELIKDIVAWVIAA